MIFVNGRLAQLVRAPVSQTGGHWFESSIAHFLFHSSENIVIVFSNFSGFISSRRASLLNFIPYFPMADTPVYTQYYHKGIELFAAGHYEDALTNLKKDLILQPDFPDAYFQIACVYSELEQYPDALSMFEKMHSLLPNDLEVFWHYGKTLLKAGEKKKGLKILQKSLKMNPKDPRSRVEMAKHLIQTEEYRKAILLLDAGIKANPSCAMFYALAGDAYRKQKKYSKALKYFELCIEIDPDYEAAKRGMNAAMRAMENENEGNGTSHPEDEARSEMLEAASLYAEGNYDQAIIKLLDLKDRPGVERDAAMLLGLAFARKGLYKRAHDVLLAFTKVHNTDILVWYNLGLASNRMGRYDQAIDDLAEALNMDEDFEEALIEMGIASQMTDDTTSAQRYFLRALKINRNDPRPYASLSRMAFDKGESDKAGEFLKRAELCDAQHPSIYYLKGYIAVVNGKFETAVRELEACLEKTPDHFEALKLLGRVRLEMSDWHNGLENYQAAAALNPSDLECRHVIQELSAHSI